jgi:hypothetical protein
VNLATPDMEKADRSGRDKTLDSVFAEAGRAAVWLDRGRYRFVAVRGVRYDVGVAEVDLASDTTVRLVVPRVVDTPGRVSADLHVHTARSYDSFLPDRMRYRSLLCTDLDLFVATDHNKATDPTRPLHELAAGARLMGVTGVEADVKSPNGSKDLGHVGAFPIAEGPPLPGRTPADTSALLAEYRARQRLAPHPATGDVVVLQLNHPRGIQFRSDGRVMPRAWGLFTMVGYDREKPLGAVVNEAVAPGEQLFLDVDAMEVINRFSHALYRETRADWFALLDQGVRVTGTGNSDSHALQVELAGFPTNLVEAPLVEGRVDLRAFADSVRAGHVTVTTGPVIDAAVGGHGPGSTVIGSSVVVDARVRAAPWVPVPEVRLVVNGDVVETAAMEGTDRAFRWTVAPERDAWVIVEAGWPIESDATPEGTYALVAPGYVPVAFTNPIRIDVTGDGWTPPGL